MQKITPFLWFDDQAEQAVNFYTTLFKNAHLGRITYYGDDAPGPKGKVMTAEFTLAGLEFMALNGGPEFEFTPATSFFVTCESEEEIDALWRQLSEGGKVLMELDTYPFSPKFGWVADSFGVSWQLSLTGQPQAITPFLMFVNEQHGKAEEAVRYYTSLFEDAGIETIERYGPDDGEPEGTVKHARFRLAGQPFMAMESRLSHAFTFTEAISFFVKCETQAEVDRLWEQLSEGGEKGQCGWLTDRYGVTWQIVPTRLGELLNDPDAARAGRVTQAMLKMTKIDLSLLEQAYLGAQA